MAKKHFVLHYNILLISLLAFLFLVTEGAPQSALVTQIPGFNDTFHSKHFAGFVFFLCFLIKRSELYLYFCTFSECFLKMGFQVC